MENAERRHSEFHDMLDWVKAWLTDPFDLVVSFLAAVALSDNKVDGDAPPKHES
jgi:hypothetical protein